MLDYSHPAVGWGTRMEKDVLHTWAVPRYHVISRYVCHGTSSDLNNRRPQRFEKPKGILIIA
jgi:hypothetical protein